MRPLTVLAALTFMVQGLAQIRPQAFSLPNGLQVVLLEDHERPLVRARLHLLLDPTTGAVRPGLAPLALRVLGRSEAGSLGADDFDQVLADSGIELTPALRGDGPTWSLVARSRDQDLALGLLADRVLRPIFDPSILEAQRLACWRETERLEASSPRTKLRLALEPDWTLQALTLDSLTAITYEDLLAFHARVFRPDRAVLVLHGDLGREQAKRLVLLSFGTWTTQPPPSPAPEPVFPSGTTGRIQIPVPRAVPRTQAVAPPPEDLSAEAEALLALLLPDDPALLPVQLQKEGSNLVATLEGGPSLPVPEAEAILMERLQALRQRGFTEADLRRARTAWTSARTLSALHPEALLDEALAEARGRAVSPARMEAFTVAALNEALRRWLDPARLRTGVLVDPGAPKPPATQ